MFTPKTYPRSFYTLILGVFALHAAALFYQTYSQEIAHSLSQSTSGLKVYFEKEPAKTPKPKIHTTPLTSATKAPAPIQEVMSTPTDASAAPAKTRATHDLKLIYLGELRELIESKKVYPLQAKRLGQTGTVEITFTLSADGHIMNARVTQSSPYDRLNQAALATVNEVRHFRPIPPEIGEDSMTVKIPMRYSLYQ
jgi:periplasmic protein TonB